MDPDKKDSTKSGRGKFLKRVKYKHKIKQNKGGKTMLEILGAVLVAAGKIIITIIENGK